MKFKILRHIGFLFCLLSSITVASAARLTVTLDSAHLLMGKSTPLHISLTATDRPDAQLLIPKDSLNAKVEILKYLKADTINHGNGRIEINQDILLQSFDSGDYRLKPILYVAGGETIQSNRLVLRVLPVMKDTIVLNDFADVSDVNRHWTDYIPDFIYNYYLYIILALLLLGGAIWFIIRRHNGVSDSDREIEIPKLSPYEQAITDLVLLRDKKLCEKGYEKQFYSDLTEILRTYLYRRFGINAMEMTTTEIKRSLQSNPDTRVPSQYMSRILDVADFVKFAKVRPLPDDNVRSFDSAMKFVEDTRPVENPTEEGKPDNNVNSDSQTTK